MPNNNIGKSAETDYMIRRSLNILLSDFRISYDELGTKEFGINQKSVTNNDEYPILLELLLTFNLWRSAKILNEALLDSISIPREWHRQTIEVEEVNLQGPIDWPETFNIRQKKPTGFKIRDFGKVIAIAQTEYVVLVLREFKMHMNLILNRLKKLLEKSYPYYLHDIIKMLQSIQQKINKTLQILSKSVRDQFKKFEQSLQEKLDFAAGELKLLLNRPYSIQDRIFSMYRNTVRFNRPKGTNLTNIVKNLASWREDYLDCKITLSDEDIFQYRRTGNVAKLYEMWCFYEICAAIKRKGVENIVQLCAIRSQQNEPQISIGEHSYVYFDFRCLSFLPTEKDQVLSNPEGIHP